MGFMDKLKNVVNPVDDEYDDEGLDNDFYFDDDTQPQSQQSGAGPAAQQPRQTSAGSMGMNSSALELKVVKPEKYDSATAQKIADHLLNRRSVVLNLESTNKESARRLIDFLSGVAYSIQGYIQRVANNTFIIVPDNVDISGEQLQEARRQEETDLY